MSSASSALPIRATGRDRRYVAAVALWLLLVVTAVGLVAALVAESSHGRIHDAPVVLVGPDVVTQPLGEDTRSQTDRLNVSIATTLREGLGRLEDGEVIAVVVLDIESSRDDIYVSSTAHPNVRDAVIAALQEIEARFGRSGRVVPVDRGHTPTDRAALEATFVAAVAGFCTVLLVSLGWGPYSRDRRRELLRVAVLGCVGVLVAAAMVAFSNGLSSPRAIATLIGVTVAVGLVALAFEAIFGWPGLALALVLSLVLPSPLLLVGDPVLLSSPWSSVLRWSIPGAGFEMLSGRQSGSAEWWFLSLAVLGATSALAATVLWVTRHRVAPHAEPTSSGAAPLHKADRIRLASSVSVIVALTVSCLSVAAAPRPSPLNLARLTVSTECAATGTIRNVADLNRVTRLRGTTAFKGGDVGVSAPLQDGRRLWLFGDTLRTVSGAESLVRNSMLVSESDCLAVVIPDGGGAVIPSRSDGTGYWPMSIITVERAGYDLVDVFAQRVRSTTGGGIFDFEILGPAIARYVVPAGETPQLLSVRDLGDDLVDTTAPMWGAAAVVRGRWAYIYGTSRRNNPTEISGFALQLARARPDSLADQATWQYWDGSTWSAQADSSVELIGSDGGPSQTLSVFFRSGRWFAFSKRDEVLGTDLVFWTAPAPQGPFTARPPVGELLSDGATGTLRYMPLAHPDLLPRRGSVVVSYSSNSTDFGKVLADPLSYRPSFLRVPLP